MGRGRDGRKEDGPRRTPVPLRRTDDVQGRRSLRPQTTPLMSTGVPLVSEPESQESTCDSPMRPDHDVLTTGRSGEVGTLHRSGFKVGDSKTK